MAAPDAPAPEQPGVLQRKVGPFPVWVWALGVGGVAAFMLHKRNQANASQSIVGGLTDVTAQAPTDLAGGNFGPSAQGQTLQGWALAAENALVAHNVNPALASKAIADYLAGAPLSKQEVDVLSKAFQYAGFPPEVLPFNGNIPSGKPTPAPSPNPTHSGNGGKLLPIAPAPLLHMLPGEQIVDSVRAPEYGAQAGYYLTNLGGVYAVGGAKFQGSAFNVLQGFNPRNFKSIVDLGKQGYELITVTGQKFIIRGQKLVSHT